jgi:hypothetical protein
LRMYRPTIAAASASAGRRFERIGVVTRPSEVAARCEGAFCVRSR